MNARLFDLPLVYIAGPYSRPDPVENTHNAVKLATELIETGLASVIVPHPTLLWHLVTPKRLEFWYELDLSHLARCDALYRFQGESTGADAEVSFAKERGIPVFDWYEWSQLLDWLANWVKR